MTSFDYVKGTTKVYGIIGNPVKHSLSPILHNTVSKMLGIDAVYVPFLVEKDLVNAAIDGAFALNVSGLNVTVPHKKEIMKYICEIDETAELIGAVNTLKRTEEGYKGFNTDITGLEKSIANSGMQIKNKAVMVLGAGGAAFSAVALAASRGAGKLYIVNRTASKALDLADKIRTKFNMEIECVSYENLRKVPKVDLLIQTTSVGMDSDENPIKDDSFFSKVSSVVDIIYTPWETRFLKDAKKSGCLTVNGFDMLIYQGLASYEIWNGITIDEDMREKIKDTVKEYYLNKR